MQTADITKSNADVCTITDLPRCFILVIFRLSSLLLTLSGTVFLWIVDTSNIKLIIGNEALYTLWAYVRDLLNMAFIMVLLFSAFCTIFQIEQYNYKKLLWKIVLMALLVNFSFPITRFIIDASNILMYTLINTEIASAFTNIAGSNGALKELLTARNFDNSSLLVVSVMIFMLAITFLAIGILLLVRMIALAILLIFSPVAFVGSIIPGVSAQASKWWDNLFKYSFFGPIMIFGVIIAVKLMNEIGAKLKDSANLVAKSQSNDPNLVGNVAFIALPIVLLWVVMGVAQSMSIAGAGAVMGAAQGAMKWSGKLPWRGIKKVAESSGVSGGIKQAWNKNITQPLDRGKQKREAWVAGKFGDKTAAERNMKTRAAEYEKNKESESDLKKWASGGDAAAAYTLASIGKIDQKTFGDALNHIKDARTKESLMSKAEDTRMDVTLQYKFDINAAKATTDPTKKAWANIQDAAKTEYGNLNVEAWSKQKNLTEQFAPSLLNPHAAEIEAGAKDAFKTILDPLAQIEALKRMRGLDATAIK